MGMGQHHWCGSKEMLAESISMDQTATLAEILTTRAARMRAVATLSIYMFLVNESTTKNQVAQRDVELPGTPRQE
jgi:hypothetical protein